MATLYGAASRRITLTDINFVTMQATTIITSGIDTSGGYYITFQVDGVGCVPSPNNPYVVIELKDNPPWTMITYEMYFTTTSSCWNFNSGGTNGTGGLLAYDPLIDRVFNCVNSFELPQYTKQMSVCDNAATNFLHYTHATGTFRSFFVTRRRDTSSYSPVQIMCELACNAESGVGKNITIRNIMVW
jgi:hypothetical protein